MIKKPIVIKKLEMILFIFLICFGFGWASFIPLGVQRGWDIQSPYIPVERARGATLEGENWLEGWTYRKSHTLQGSLSGSVTNYPIKFMVHYGSGADSGEDVYLNEQCRTDFGDLRFTRNDGQTELDYWIEKKDNENNAIIWVEVDSITASPNTATIFMYYGNPAVTTTGITSIFSFLETWDTSTGKVGSVTSSAGASGSIDNWYYKSQSWAETNTDTGYIGNSRYVARHLDGIYLWGGSGNLNRSVPLNIPQQGLEFYYKFDVLNGAGTNYHRMWVELTLDDDGTAKKLYYLLYKYDWDPSFWPSDPTIKFIDLSGESPNTWHKFVRDVESDAEGFATGNILDIKIYAGNERENGSGNSRIRFWVDQIKFRNYISPEPTNGNWGGEESEWPTITVESPNGGEEWSGTQSITWMANDPQGDPLTYTVYYSATGGGSWTQLAIGLSTPSYSWDTSVVDNGANYLIKVEAHDGSYLSPDVSDGPFEILNTPPVTTTTTTTSTPPVTTTTTTTSTPPVTTTTTTTSTPPVTTTTTTTSTLPETTTTLPNQAPTVRVIRPNGGEVIQGEFELKWIASDPDGDSLTFMISYSPNGGETWTLLASGVTTMSYTWNTSKVIVGEVYLIEVHASDAESTAIDHSDAPFTIERETETDATGGFIPSFGLIEGIFALGVLMGLFRWRKRRIE